MPSLKLLLERFWHEYDVPRPLKLAISFRCGSYFEHSKAQLNMDQGQWINNWTVKFVVSCFVVSEQLEISTILVSVESTALRYMLVLVRCFVRYVVLEIYLYSRLIELLNNFLIIFKPWLIKQNLSTRKLGRQTLPYCIQLVWLSHISSPNVSLEDYLHTVVC